MSALAALIARDSRSTSSSTSYSTSSSSATYCPTVASSSAYDYYEIAQLEELGKRGLAHEREVKAKQEAYNAYMAGERERMRQEAHTAYIAAERQRQEVNRDEAVAAKLAAARSARRAQVERQLKESQEAYAAYIAAERQRLRDEVVREDAAKRSEYAQRQAAVAKVNNAYRHAYKQQKTFFQNQLDDARDNGDEAAFEKIQEEWLGAMEAQRKSFNRLKHHEATKPLTASGAASAPLRPNANRPLPAVPTASRTTRTTASSSRRAAADQLLRYYDQQQAEYNSAIADIDRLLAATAISRSNEQRQAEYDATIANLDRLLARR